MHSVICSNVIAKAKQTNLLLFHIQGVPGEICHSLGYDGDTNPIVQNCI